MVLKILVLIYGFLLYIIPGEGCLLLNLNHEEILGSTKKRLGAFHGSCIVPTKCTFTFSDFSSVVYLDIGFGISAFCW